MKLVTLKNLEFSMQNLRLGFRGHIAIYTTRQVLRAGWPATATQNPDFLTVPRSKFSKLVSNYNN